MSFEAITAAHTEALNANTAMMERHIAALGAAANAATSNPSAKDTSSKTTSTVGNKTSDAGKTAEPIYYKNPKNAEEFGTVETEAEWKKLKKATPSLIKIPVNMYEELVAAASKVGGGDDDGDVSEFVAGRIASFPEEPEESDIVTLFQGYLSQDLDKAERTKRAGLIKPILESVNAPKATAVKAEDRRDVMVAVTKAMEAHIEETDQTSPFAEADEEDGLV